MLPNSTLQNYAQWISVLLQPLQHAKPCDEPSFRDANPADREQAAECALGWGSQSVGWLALRHSPQGSAVIAGVHVGA